MRCTQLVGLPKEAVDFLDENAIRIAPCVTCGRGGGVKSKPHKDASGAGMFDDGPMLMEYECEDGIVAREEVQAAPWASGPCIFLSLETFQDGVAREKFEWTEEQIQNNL